MLLKFFSSLKRSISTENAYPSHIQSPFQSTNSFLPPLTNDSQNYVVPETFLLILDADEGSLGFAETNGRFLGTAFRGLKAASHGRPLFPMASAVWGHAEVTINYLGGANRE